MSCSSAVDSTETSRRGRDNGGLSKICFLWKTLKRGTMLTQRAVDDATKMVRAHYRGC
jgi:hypothetical protein